MEAETKEQKCEQETARVRPAYSLTTGRKYDKIETEEGSKKEKRGIIKNMAEMKRGIKDSVFSYLFRQPEYMLELYRTLHPEDTSATQEDLKLITIENILLNGQHNDLGLLIRDILIVLMEAQSTFTLNVVIRLLLYLTETLKQHIKTHELDLYGGKPVRIPRPELYVVYTGNRKDIPETIQLSDLYEGKGSVEVTVRVIRGSGDRSIVDQYIRFCKITDEERKKRGYTKKAIEETIQRCLRENVLTSFLDSCQKEVQDIMFTLFNQEEATRIHYKNVARDAHEKGIAKGEARGIEKGRTESKLEIAKRMLSAQLPFDQIAMLTGLSLAEVERLAV